MDVGGVVEIRIWDRVTGQKVGRYRGGRNGKGWDGTG